MNTKTKALGISFGFHSLMALLALWALSVTHSPIDAPETAVKTMMLLSLDTYEAPQPLPLSAPSPSEPVPVPVKEMMPKEAVVKPAPLPVKPIEQTVAQPSPAQPIPSAHQEPAAPVQQTVAAVSKPVSVAPVAAAPAPVKELSKIDLAAEKRNFFASLRSTIQKHLRYPSAARRRGMEGDVDVRFVLESSGTIRNISIREGEEIFHNAAKMAVASASGVKVPETLASNFPTEIDLSLEFRLN